MTSVRVAVAGISAMAGMLNSRNGPPAIFTLVIPIFVDGIASNQVNRARVAWLGFG